MARLRERFSSQRFPFQRFPDFMNPSANEDCLCRALVVRKLTRVTTTVKVEPKEIHSKKTK